MLEITFPALFFALFSNKQYITTILYSFFSNIKINPTNQVSIRFIKIFIYSK